MSDEKHKKDQDVLLSVNDLCMYFDVKGKRIKASEHITFSIRQGETYGLVGESGSGKSTIGKCIIGLNKATGGSILTIWKQKDRLSFQHGRRQYGS